MRTSRIYILGLATFLACSFDKSELAGPPGSRTDSSIPETDAALTERSDATSSVTLLDAPLDGTSGAGGREGAGDAAEAGVAWDVGSSGGTGGNSLVGMDGPRGLLDIATQNTPDLLGIDQLMNPQDGGTDVPQGGSSGIEDARSTGGSSGSGGTPATAGTNATSGSGGAASGGMGGITTGSSVGTSGTGGTTTGSSGGSGGTVGLADAGIADAMSCIQSFKINGYSLSSLDGGLKACSECKASNGYSLETPCKAMIDCLVTAWACKPVSACWTYCRNNTPGSDMVVDACVSTLVKGACP